MTERILVIDDKENICRLLATHLQSEGFQVDTAPDGEQGLARFDTGSYDLVITDVKMPGMDGLDVLRRIKDRSPDTVVVLITAFADMDDAIAAMKMGAFDYLKKPFKLEEIQATVEKALENRRLLQENRRLRQEVEQKYSFDNIVARSKPMKDVFTRIERVAGAASTVLITGETGTGKELVARSIHYNSPRKNNPFVVVNCGAIPVNLIESELFGHVRGAFTDAIATKPGRFEDAHGGTLFLDEIGELEMSVQGKLLRVLQESEVTRIGESKMRKVDVRVVCATNKILDQEIHTGGFRKDLFYRINVVPIHLPPLRDRPEDITLLLNHFLAQFTKDNNSGEMRFAPSALARLLAHAWPGNVRELMNVVERCVLMSDNLVIEMDDLPPEIAGGSGAAHGGPFNAYAAPGLMGDENKVRATVPSQETSLKRAMEQAAEIIEPEMIRRAIESAAGNKDKAAKILDISRRSLFYKLKQYGMN
jgi:DNA-binding NtrC family response regulator